MAIDTKGAIIGGLAGGGAGALIGGSGILGKSKVPTYNPAFAINQAQAGQEAENRAIGSFKQGSQAGIDAFKTGISGAEEAAQTQSQGAASDYLQAFDPLTSKVVQQRQDALKRSLFGQIPELVQAGREAGAAGGGLDRGVVQSQLAGIPLEQGRQFSEGAQALETEALSQQLNARSKVYDASNQLILSKLGIDENTQRAILDSGNQALIQELNSIIDNSRNSIGLQIQADSAAQGSAIGAAQNSAANKQAMINGLLGIGGTIAGGMVGGPAGAAVGGQAGSAISGLSSNASTYTPRYNGLPPSLSLR